MMHTTDAYAALAKELEVLRKLSPAELMAMLGQGPLVRSLTVAGQTIDLEFSAAWADRTERSVRITGHARGPSTWHTEHLQESITVPVHHGAAGSA